MYWCIASAFCLYEILNNGNLSCIFITALVRNSPSLSSRHHHVNTSALRIGSDFVNPSKSVKDLGIYFDADLSMRCHVQKTVASCFAVLRQLRSIRRSVSTSVYQALVDYGNAVLVGLPGYLYSRLQSVLNAAARSIAGLWRSDHITDTLASFHWMNEYVNLYSAQLEKTSRALAAK